MRAAAISQSVQIPDVAPIIIETDVSALDADTGGGRARTVSTTSESVSIPDSATNNNDKDNSASSSLDNKREFSVITDKKVYAAIASVPENKDTTVCYVELVLDKNSVGNQKHGDIDPSLQC